MRSAPRSIRPHIAIFGICNVGKSTLINSLADQKVALVSEEPGTTTDPVYKSMELQPFGPVVFIDTAGLDDPGVLGQQRKQITSRILRKADAAILLVGEDQLNDWERDTKSQLEQREIPHMILRNVREDISGVESEYTTVNALKGNGIEIVKKELASMLEDTQVERPVVRDLLDDTAPVVLVTPIDSSAPRGRMILPQVQTLRDIIDGGFSAVVCQETELQKTLKQLAVKPQLVITDSRVFGEVAETLRNDIPLTSFSILMARYKGDIFEMQKGGRAIEKLEKGASVLIAEACTHHRQKNDIGTVLIPQILQECVGGELDFTFYSGKDMAHNLSDYDLVVHCGGCMITRGEMLERIERIRDAGVPAINYGIFLAYSNGILARAMKPIETTNK